jgi:hypothetical protein
MSSATWTTDHDRIREWTEQRGGYPATVAETDGEQPGILRIGFRDETGDLEEISWEDFFEKFDQEELAFLHQDQTEDGGTSRFCKFVER